MEIRDSLKCWSSSSPLFVTGALIVQGCIQKVSYSTSFQGFSPLDLSSHQRSVEIPETYYYCKALTGVPATQTQVFVVSQVLNSASHLLSLEASLLIHTGFNMTGQDPLTLKRGVQLI